MKERVCVWWKREKKTDKHRGKKSGGVFSKPKRRVHLSSFLKAIITAKGAELDHTALMSGHTNVKFCERMRDKQNRKTRKRKKKKQRKALFSLQITDSSNPDCRAEFCQNTQIYTCTAL